MSRPDEVQIEGRVIEGTLLVITIMNLLRSSVLTPDPFPEMMQFGSFG